MAIKKFTLRPSDHGFVLEADGRVAFVHDTAEPALSMGTGEARIAMHHGNFDIEDELRELCPLSKVEIGADGASVRFCSEGGRWAATMRISIEDGRLALRFSEASAQAGTRRVRIRLPAESREHVYGCGEQFSYFDLRGHKFPLWTSEQGVGRNKSMRITHEQISTTTRAAITGGPSFHSPPLFRPKATGCTQTRALTQSSTSGAHVPTSSISGNCRPCSSLVRPIQCHSSLRT